MDWVNRYIMQKQKLIKVLKKQLFILGIWTLGVIAGASIINWYYLLPTLKVQTVFIGGCVACDMTKESKSEMTEDNSSDGQVAINPKAQEESTRLEGDSRSVIKKVAEEEGIDWKLLYAICLKESHCTEDRVGDSGKSLGAFQIHQGYQPGTKDCALSLKCSAEWTAKRLKKYAHLGEWEMIRSHNGLVGDRNGDGELDNAYYPNDVLKIISSL